MTCRHVYENIGADVCPACGRVTHEVKWEEQHAIHHQYKIDNPNAKSDGWWSI